MSTDNSTVLVTEARLAAFIASVLQRVGLPADDAGAVGRLMAEADLQGSDGHGVGSSRVDLQACKLEYSIVSPK